MYIGALCKNLTTFITYSKGEIMKIKYDSLLMMYEVKGLGYFRTQEEALKAISENEKKTDLRITITPKLKEQLRLCAITRNTTIADIVRQAIEKEVTSD
jgi:hypothetical protein